MKTDFESDPKVEALIKLAAPVLGLLLLVGVIILVTVGVRLLISPGYRAPLDNRTGGVIVLAASLGVLVIANRLLGGERLPNGGVLPPWLIAVGGLLFLFAPVIVYRVTHNLHLVFASSAIWAGVAASAIRTIRSRRNG